MIFVRSAIFSKYPRERIARRFNHHGAWILTSGQVVEYRMPYHMLWSRQASHRFCSVSTVMDQQQLHLPSFATVYQYRTTHNPHKLFPCFIFCGDQRGTSDVRKYSYSSTVCSSYVVQSGGSAQWARALATMIRVLLCWIPSFSFPPFPFRAGAAREVKVPIPFRRDPNTPLLRVLWRRKNHLHSTIR
jgi:hypothetical protein